IKVVTNAGALNPKACADALSAMAAELGLQLTIAAVTGDDLIGRSDAVRAAAPHDMVTGRPVPDGLSSLNAYLGARPVADALQRGADVVITGRCVDAAVVLGPLMHEFGWKDDEYDLLAAGSLAGHIVECGPQATGGNVTDWEQVPGWDNLGYPLAEVFPDGTAVIGKPAGTGGSVTPLTVGEQVVYEIGDPGAYLLPDVICDWREVRLVQDGPDRVRVSGARGSAPTTAYKATGTRVNGYRALTTAMFAGVGAAGKAARMGRAVIDRAERIGAERGLPGFAETSVEVVGSGQLTGREPDPAATEAVVKVGIRGETRDLPDIFAAEFASMALVAQGMTGVFAGRPRVAPVFEVYHLQVDKAAVPVQVVLGQTRADVEVAPGSPGAQTATSELPDVPPVAAAADTVEVPLVAVAVARSGDKGDNANIGVIARRPEFAPVLREQLTSARVARVFAHLAPSAVSRWALPGLDAVNFLIRDVLGGCGGTSTLRYDPQGKSYAATLLAAPVRVPAQWVREGIIPSPEGAA
ncbi:MAG TPA: acyclic terpene utilization AtuA family protein, partial [Trebonia sp.]|nr:acyclic terpene utilization AtuA family protein [Trebonia sp.]